MLLQAPLCSHYAECFPKPSISLCGMPRPREGKHSSCCFVLQWLPSHSHGKVSMPCASLMPSRKIRGKSRLVKFGKLLGSPSDFHTFGGARGRI